MSLHLQLESKRFGRWLVLKDSKKVLNGWRLWECICDCGTKRLVRGATLVFGSSRSCGCLRDEKRIQTGFKNRNGSILPLLEESLEAYYWAGFIAADGSICHNRLKITLSTKDEKHLLKLARFIACPNIQYEHSNKHPNVSVSIMDKNLIPKFAKKFDFKPRKTYNPPNLDRLKGDKFLAFFAGYIDGDGYISKQSNVCFQISIHCHKNWIPALKFMEKQFYKSIKIKKYKSHIYLDSKGFVTLYIGISYYLKLFKEKIIKLKLPILKRKWNRINIANKNLVFRKPKI